MIMVTSNVSITRASVFRDRYFYGLYVSLVSLNTSRLSLSYHIQRAGKAAIQLSDTLSSEDIVYYCGIGVLY
ncbi:hypothetical protein BDV27DRAFT_71225 [Aspergillus caelatus]|uniref:Uncharacterized protein n=1 Tax=Aspergillus caelatus TaxID=61420 RepID=A0A5N6ZKY5_9EURO|nr:uncharacterized protein BDV27DRAFT_71225 [Aspergillus caelatus]KAE8358287.1 hypothetical protein BDV27DRAFT_71225 [Aspergillus caelatus]